PIGLVQVSGAPQCQSTWTPIMNTTARPRARSNARTRSRGARPVTASVACIRASVGSITATPVSGAGDPSCRRAFALPVECAAALALALVLGQQPLAQPDRRGRHLDELVLGDELQGQLQGEGPWRREPERLVVGVGPDVGELLLLGRVHVHVARPAVLADDHALVDLHAGADEQLGALLEVE